jgi:long-chain acyl-CoA synthetase
MPSATKNNAILERWAVTLRRRGPEAAILTADGAVERNFSGVEAEAGEWLGRFEEIARPARFSPGAVLAIQLPNSPAWPAIILAAMRCGLIPLPIGSNLAATELESILGICSAAALVRPNGSLSLLGGRAGGGGEGGQSTSLDCDYLKLTSGTTSQPRMVRFTAAQLAADCDNICDTKGIVETDLNYAVIPLSHSYGFSNLVTPLLCRGVPFAVSADPFPHAILRGLARTCATVFPGMPVFFEKLASIESPLLLPALRLCISAGAPLTARVGEAFTARFGLKIHTFYGSSECGGIGYDASNEPVYEEGFAGQPMQNVTVTPHGDTGQIAVRGAAVGLGYFPTPDPDVLDGGRFIPGDLATMTPRGMILSGRATDIINIAGRKMNPAEIEHRLAACPGVRQVALFGIPSQLRNEEAIACVAGAVEPEAFLQFARSILSGWQVPRDVWLVDELPVNERGKISRRDLARAYMKMRPTSH